VRRLYECLCLTNSQGMNPTNLGDFTDYAGQTKERAWLVDNQARSQIDHSADPISDPHKTRD